MKRSFINQKIEQTYHFFSDNGFYLPAWALWSSSDWQVCQFKDSIQKNALGWDITNFGHADFNEQGLSLFSLRNGLAEPSHKPYCEKIMHVRDQQVTPYHYHKNKIEDIIVRGGTGVFCLSLIPTNSEQQVDLNVPIEIEIDGFWREVRPKEIIQLKRGQSITLPPFLYHKFWAENGDCMVGEVSTINNDLEDNYFLDGLGRFATIEEDEKSKYILCNEY